MTRSILLLILLIGAANAWNYGTGYDSHPWNIKNIWVKRSSDDLPLPPVRAKAHEVSYIHKRSEETTVLPQPIVRENAKTVIYTPGVFFG